MPASIRYGLLATRRICWSRLDWVRRWWPVYNQLMDVRGIITIEPGKRGGKPCVRGMRIAVADVLGWLAAGMSHAEVIADFPELTEQDIRACLSFAAERETRTVTAA